jgi:hypothetical protein
MIKDTWDELMIKLAEHVVTQYPNSEFAKLYRKDHLSVV